ncbi:MAG: TrkH family potassium uptake protein [Treponema sp.]|nr:TrkH family potassium uptake protein [Treponema sp.]
MKLNQLLRIIFVLLGIVGITFLIPISVALCLGENQVISSFLIPMIIVILLGIASIYVGRKKSLRISMRGAFIVAALSWISASFLGAIPLFTSGSVTTFTDAFFESVSAFTTTGATIINDVESLPNAINVWRCLMHWLGGMGIVALTVAFMPLLGVGGFQLIKAETTGPEKGKVTPKITNTAKILWFIYFILTVLQTVLLLISGLNFVDAISIAFSTLGTGGFALKNASIGAYNSASVDWICIVFMVLAGINFSLYYYAVTGKIQDIIDNTELKVYLGIVVLFSVGIAFFILPRFHSFLTALRYAAFQVGAIITTTGFATDDYIQWAYPAQFLLFLLFFTGACSGSTGGGIKIIRWVILSKQGSNEIRKMLHPHGIFSIQLNGKVGRKDVVFNVAAFLYFYFFLLFITTFIGTFANLDLLTSFTGALSTLGNVGPAFGALGPTCNYSSLPAFLKWWYSFVMLAGRLELYTMMIYFTGAFWKK